MNLENILSEKLDTKGYLLYDFMSMKYPEQASQSIDRLVIAKDCGKGSKRTDCLVGLLLGR